MHFVVASRHIKQFSKSLQCISRIGDDLYIDVHEDHIKFITVNTARSAYVTFTFHSSFFQNYIFSDDDVIPENQYRVKSKLCFQMFHSLSNIDKCAMKIINDENKISFYLLCKNGIQKIYSMNYEEAKCPAAVYNRDPPYKISAKPKQLSECLNYFANSVEEIALEIQKDRLILKSQVDEKKPSAKALSTEVTVDYQDFDNYVFRGPGTEISFGLKDIKTILSYIDVINNPYNILIDSCGRPLNINFNYNSTFQADFVLATLFNANAQKRAQQVQSAPVTPQHHYNQQQHNQYNQQQQYYNHIPGSSGSNNDNHQSYNSRPDQHAYRNTTSSPSVNQNYQQPQQQPIYSSHEDDDMMDGMPIDHDLQQQQQQQFNQHTPNSNYRTSQQQIYQQQIPNQQYIYQQQIPNQQNFGFQQQFDIQQHQQQFQQDQHQQFDYQQIPNQQQLPLSNTSATYSKRTIVSYRSDLNLDENDDDEDEEYEQVEGDENHIQSSNN